MKIVVQEKLMPYECYFCLFEYKKIDRYNDEQKLM